MGVVNELCSDRAVSSIVAQNLISNTSFWIKGCGIIPQNHSNLVMEPETALVGFIDCN